MEPHSLNDSGTKRRDKPSSGGCGNTALQYKVRGLDNDRYPLRWAVENDLGDKYIVDFDRGTCTCSHFVFRLSKKATEPERRCKHILLARDRLADLVINHRKSC